MEEIQRDTKPDDNELIPAALYTAKEEMAGTKHTSWGPLISIGIVVLILLLGGLYLWGSTLIKEEAEENSLLGNPNEDAAETASDEISDIETNLNENFLGTEDDFSEIDAALEGQ